MKKRLLLLEALPIISGGQQVLLDIVAALPDYELHALLPAPGPLAEALTAQGVTCHFVNMASYTLVQKTRLDLLRFPLDQLRLAYQCAVLARRLQIDLIYANSSRTFVWGTLAAALAHRPIFWHQHNLLDDPKTLALIRYLGQCQIVKRIIAVSQVAAVQFPTLTPKIVVLPTGVNTTTFQPNLTARQKIRQEFNIPPETQVIGIIGNLIPLKRQHIVLDAAHLTSLKLHYLIVGDTRADEESKNYARQLHKLAGDNVIFTGQRHDLPNILNALDLLVIASERETGPLVLLEAMACGIPVISTPVGRATELLPPEAIFPTDEVMGLVNCLAFWLSDCNRLQLTSKQVRLLAETELDINHFHQGMRRELEQLFMGR